MTTPDDSTTPAWGPPPSARQEGHPPGRGGSAAPGTNTKAVVALVLAVAAYTPTVPFVGAIAALWVSRMARREIRAGGESGLGLCRTADVLAVVHLVLIGLAVLVIVALFLLPFSFV